MGIRNPTFAIPALALLALPLLVLLVGARSAGAADQAPGGSASAPWDCRQDPDDPMPLCKCQGGHGSPDCQAMKRSGACSDRDGLTMMCCDPVTRECRCEAGGCKKRDQACVCADLFPEQARRRIREHPGRKRPGVAAPTGGAPSRRRFHSGFGIVQMGGREAEDPDRSGSSRETGGAPSPGSLDPSTGRNIIHMNGVRMSGPRPVGTEGAGSHLDPEACSCWNGIGSCTVEGGRCAPAGGDLGCTGTCSVEDPGAKGAGNIEQETLHRVDRRAPRKSVGDGPVAPAPPKKPGYIRVQDHWERERAR